MTFENLNLIAPIFNAIKSEWYKVPTPIQMQAIPAILQWRDILWCAQTWTWKTAAFAIPTLQILHNKRGSGDWNKWIKALIITPTRELAIQIHESFWAYWKWTNLRSVVIFWGVKQHLQERQLRSGTDILVATPWRLLDLCNQGIINLNNLLFFTLDEADRMLDMGFIHDVKKIIAKLPAKRQSLFFSATMPPSIVNLSSSLLTNPVSVKVTPVSSTAETVSQKMYMVEKKNKKSLLIGILKDASMLSVLVFTRTKHWANKIAEHINKSGIETAAIHWNKSQSARQNALNKFKTKQMRVLVATDIAARGIDIDQLSHVINYEIPNVPETYVHRIWRTGRAKSSGIALSFCDKDELAYVRDIHKLINTSIPVENNHQYHVDHWPIEPKKSSQKSTHNPNRSKWRWSRPRHR